MASANIEALRIPEAKKRYIAEKLNPLLEEIVTECLTSAPDDPVDFMITWLRDKKLASDPSGEAVELPTNEENERLKEELKQAQARLAEASNVITQLTATEGPDEAEEEEEDDDDDDDCDELPPDFLKPETQMGKNRASVSAEAYGEWNQKKAFTPPVYDKTDEQKARINDVLAKSFMFAALDEKDLAAVVAAMKEVKLEPKQRVINQGEDGDFLFVIEVGTLDCYKKFPDSDEEKLVKSCEPGDTFGELALLYNCPRAASVESRDACVLWQLDRETFNHIVRDAASKKREKYESFLKKVSILETMDDYERSQIADALKPETAQKDAEIVQQGDSGDKFYIIEEGSCAAFKNGEKVMDLNPGDYFGELALLKDEPRAATVTTMTDSAKLLVLDRRSFKRLLGPLQSLLSKAAGRYD